MFIINKFNSKSILLFVLILIIMGFLLRNDLIDFIWKANGKSTISSVQKRLEKQRSSDINSLFGNISNIDSIVILGIKRDRTLEVWAKRKDNKDNFINLKNYNFFGYSGEEGPKFKKGDGQIPEGFYGIEYLNPNSKYHLSMKLTYPNPLDIEMGIKDKRSNLGNDIFIHGNNLTIGCIPIGDKNIEELFYLVSKVGKERTKVIIAPVDFRKNDIPANRYKYDWIIQLYEEIKTAMQEFKT